MASNGLTMKQTLATAAGLGLALMIAASPASAASSKWNNTVPEVSDGSDTGGSTRGSTRGTRGTVASPGEEDGGSSSSGGSDSGSGSGSSVGSTDDGSSGSSWWKPRKRTVSSEDSGAAGLGSDGEPQPYRVSRGSRSLDTGSENDSYVFNQGGWDPWRKQARHREETRRRSFWIWWGSGENN